MNRKYGVEIEFTNLDGHAAVRAMRDAGINTDAEGYNHTTRSHWKIVTDSSCGYEAVSPILEGEDGLEEIKIVCAVLEGAGAKVNKNCGVHVHFDASDFNLENFKNLFKYWVKFEDVFDSLMPASRRLQANQYCNSNLKVRASDAASHAQACQEIFTQIDAITTIEQFKQLYPSRYHKLNPHSYWRHGTIEVRHHSGSIDGEKITQWIRLMDGLFTRAKQAKVVKFKTTEAYGREGGYGIQRMDSLFITMRMTGQHELTHFFRQRARTFAAKYGYATATR
jgi:hypothetical protein